MPLKMYFYLQMLMKLQNMNHLGKEWGYYGCFAFTPSSSVVTAWREKPNHRHNLRQTLLLSVGVWVQGFCGEFNPTDLFWASPRWETKPWAPWRCPSSPRTHWTATRRGSVPGPRRTTYPNTAPVAGLWPLALRNCLFDHWCAQVIRPLFYCSCWGLKQSTKNDKEWEGEGVLCLKNIFFIKKKHKPLFLKYFRITEKW